MVTLQAYDYVEHNPSTLKYRLGVACLELGSVFLNETDIRVQAVPILERLRDACKETVHLARLAGSDIVYLEKLDGLLPIGMIGSQVGRRAPAYCTGLGKAILAYRPAEEVHQFCAQSGLVRFTPNTITDLEELLRELALTKQRGYAVDDEEHELDVKCVAVPVWNHRGEVVGAVSITGPAKRIEEAMACSDLVSRVKDAGWAISRRLAGDCQPGGQQN
jgi:DNA-binding IclR family transcriptional regulator